MKSETLQENVQNRDIGDNWYTYFYDESYGWSWSPQYINKYHGEDGKRLTVRVNPDFRNKWQGFNYKGGKTFNDINKKSYGIEIYTPLYTKIKTYDTVKIDENGNIIIGGDTILNIIGEVIQAGNGEYMIGRYDTVRDDKGKIISDEIIKAEIETYGNSIDFDCDNESWSKYKKRQEDPKRQAIWVNWPWYSTDVDDNKTLYIKNGTKVITQNRTHFCNANGLLNGETTSAGYIRLDKTGEIKLSNGVIINAPKNTLVSVEYKSGECTVTIGDDNATITKSGDTEVTVLSGTIIDNEGNIIK